MTTTITTAELIRKLDQVAELVPGSSSGYLSQLDEQVLRLKYTFPELEAPHNAFSQARMHVRRGQAGDAWQRLVDSALALSAMIGDSLGETEIQLCQEKTEHGTCRLALAPDTGACPWPERHKTA